MLALFLLAFQSIASGPTLFNPTSNGVTLVFTTDKDCLPRITVDAADGTSSKEITLSNPRRKQFSITVTGLTSGKDYVWWASFDTTRSSKYQFTIPSSTYTLGLFGQNSPTNTILTDLVSVMTLEGCTGFVGLGGYTTANSTTDQWNSNFFAAFGGSLQTLPIFGCRGETDGETSTALTSFPIPNLPERSASDISLGVGRWAAWTYGLVRFVILDSNNTVLDPQESNPGPLSSTRQSDGTQTAFIASEIASSDWKNASYRVAIFHRPHKTEQWTATCGDFNNDSDIQTNLTEQLIGGGCSVVINSYSNSYQRGTISSNAKTGVWIISGGASTSLHTNQCTDLADITINPVADQFTHFLKMSVSPSAMIIKCIKQTRVEYDSVTINPATL